mgnify:CR=1 FL=1
MQHTHNPLELSKSYIDVKGRVVFYEKPHVKVIKAATAVLKVLPTSVLLMVTGMFLTQIYLLFTIFQTIQRPSGHPNIFFSLSIFIMLGIFICIAFQLGWSLVNEKEETLAKAKIIRKARRSHQSSPK